MMHERLFTTVVVLLVACGLLVAPAAAPAQDPGGVELADDIHAKVAALSERGDRLAERERYREAIKVYREALQLLPAPHTQWEACTWLQAAIGDASFLDGQYDQARSVLSDAMLCPGAIGNPFIHLRLGQAQLELGNRERAADELARAYAAAGKDIFESEDPKYFAFLKTVLKAPAGGKW